MFVYIYFYKPKENSSRTDLKNDDQNVYVFAPTYGDGSTNFHRHMISVVVYSYSNILQSVLVDYTVTDMGCFDDYSDDAPCAKTMRGNGITTFLLHVAQCITFNQKKLITATIIYEARLRSIYSRLYFKVPKDFATSPTFEKARK